jgi:hypothetical protein
VPPNPDKPDPANPAPTKPVTTKPDLTKPDPAKPEMYPETYPEMHENGRVKYRQASMSRISVSDEIVSDNLLALTFRDFSRFRIKFSSQI